VVGKDVFNSFLLSLSLLEQPALSIRSDDKKI
jgi:hypothetical protein